MGKTSFSQCSRVDTRRRVRVRSRVRALARVPATERVLVYEYQRDSIVKKRVFPMVSPDVTFLRSLVQYWTFLRGFV